MRVAIIGIGHMGSWLARELNKKNEVAIYDIDESKTREISNVKILTNLQELNSFKTELLINAVNLQNTINTFKEIIWHIPKDCIICDVASVKGEIPVFYADARLRFVSIHPMFGPTFADLHTLKNENVVIIKESDKEGAEFFSKFFKQFGLNIFQYTFEEHDKMMAYSLTLPFVSSMVFAGCVKQEVVPGTTFAKHRGIAKGLLSEDDNLLAEILFNEHSVEQLNRITSQLEFLKHVIKAREFEEMKEVFDKLRKNLGEQ